jgi:hypothetical protein
MPVDSELGVKLVPDESALESIEEKELEVSGEAGAVDDAKELNEEQSSKLTLVNRKLGRVAGRLGKIAAILAVLGVIAKILGSVFDIGFEDVRNAIVDALDKLLDPIKTAFGGSKEKFEEQSQIEQAMTPGPLGFISAVAPGLLDLESNQSGSSGSSNGSASVNLFTSRDSLTGDSTQQEQSTQNFDYFKFQGGS